jgi:hypothetical protein
VAFSRSKSFGRKTRAPLGVVPLPSEAAALEATEEAEAAVSLSEEVEVVGLPPSEEASEAAAARSTRAAHR